MAHTQFLKNLSQPKCQRQEVKNFNDQTSILLRIVLKQILYYYSTHDLKAKLRSNLIAYKSIYIIIKNARQIIKFRIGINQFFELEIVQSNIINYTMKEQERESFAQQFLQITPKIIKTSFGNIYSLTAGMPGQPLILVVHGSGPNNSADQYNYLLHQYLVKISYIQKFYVVAIDCPGYGRSEGSKQVVKIFPLKLFEQILEQLQYTNYFAMLGNSQGGAAIFNAVLKSPKITNFLIMDRPICGNIQRFKGFSLPTLLIYDIQDTARPVQQGKLLHKLLKNTELYMYRNSTHQFWVQNQIWEKMLHFFSKNFELQPKYNQQISFQNNNNQGLRFRTNNQQIKRERSYSLGGAFQKNPRQSNLLGIQLVGKPIQLQSRVNGQKFQSFKEGDSLNKSRRKRITQHEKPTKTKDEVQRQKFFSRPKQVLKEQLKDQYKCAICYQTLFKPMTTNCKHNFCSHCLMESLLINQKCPLCRAKITKKTQNKQLNQKLLQYISNNDFIRREKQFKKIEAMVKSIVYIEMGNTSQLIKTKKSIFTKTNKKYSWQFYIKQPKNFQIQQVEFNINMDDQICRPIKLRHKPFTFESRSIYSFDCKVTIKPKNKEYPDLSQIYMIDVDPGTHSKIIPLRKKCYMK